MNYRFNMQAPNQMINHQTHPKAQHGLRHPPALGPLLFQRRRQLCVVSSSSSSIPSIHSSEISDVPIAPSHDDLRSPSTHMHAPSQRRSAAALARLS